MDSSKLLFICVAVAFGSYVQSMAEKAVGSHLLPAQRHPCSVGRRDEISRRNLSLRAEGWALGLYIAVAVEESLVFLGKPKHPYKLCPELLTLPSLSAEGVWRELHNWIVSSLVSMLNHICKAAGFWILFYSLYWLKMYWRAAFSAMRIWQFGSQYTGKSSVLIISFKLPLLTWQCEWSSWCLHAGRGSKHRRWPVTRLTSFQQGSVSSEAELSQYFSHDSMTQLPFSDAVTSSSDEEQLRQKNRNSLLDDGSLLPGNLSKQRKCVWSFG